MKVAATTFRWRHLHWVQQLLFRQSIPFGLVSLRYLAGNLTPQQRTHRLLLCRGYPQFPHIVKGPLNAWLWLRWIMFSAWYYAVIAVRLHGLRVKADCGVNLVQQFYDVLYLALFHTIPPSAYYRFRLYLPDRKKYAWHYIYNNEIASFHSLRDGNSGERYQRQRHTLSDKHQFTHALQLTPIRLAESQLLNAGAIYSQLNAETGESVFCKPRIGSRAIGAFSVRWDNALNPEVQQLDDTLLSGHEARKYINTRFSEHDYLVQPCYGNHVDLTCLNAANEEAISLRIITERKLNGFGPYCAYLEIPRISTSGKIYYSLQVDTATGIVDANGIDPLQHQHGPQLKQLTIAADGLKVPHWHQSLDFAIVAHDRFDAIHAIAWDFIITSDGPVLLEGNTNWRVDLPQQLCGGLLATADQA